MNEPLHNFAVKENAWLNRFFLGAAMLIAAAALWRVQTVVRWQLNAPFDLVFESPNLATINALGEGINVYHPNFFNAPPFVFTLYTPFYHLICAAMPGHLANPFLTGRLVALGFLTLAVLGVWWAARPRSLAVTFLAIGLFLLLHPVVANAAFLKNDGTALFFSMLALLMVRLGARSSLQLAGAALCCVLALASKQVFVSASAACFFYLLIQDRRAAWRFGLYYLLFAAAGAALAQIWWGNGFWFCVLNAPRMPFDSGQFATQWGLMLRQPVFVLLMGSWLLTAAAYFRQRAGRELIGNPFFLYFLFAGAILLLTIGKPGSSTNYFIEPCLAGVCCLVSLSPPLLGRPGCKPAIAGVCLAVAFWELASAKTRDFAFADPPFLTWRGEFHDSLLAEASSLVPGARPLRVLNLATASTFHDWPGETSVNDPYLYSLLWKHGVLEPGPMQRALRSQAYDLIVFRNGTAPEPGADGMGQIMATMRDHYRPLKSESIFQYWIRRPGRMDTEKNSLLPLRPPV